jgi:hypothetical protein
MWTVAHSTFGAAIGSKVRSPWLAGALGLLSHALLDMIPHWDYTELVPLGVWVILDQTAALVILVWILRRSARWQASLAAAAMAALPDVEGALIYLGWQRRYYFLSHLPGFPHQSTETLLGVLTQTGIIVLSLFLVARQRRSVLRST